MSQKITQLLNEMEALAEKLGIKIRYEVTKARGGLCNVDGKLMFILDKKSTKEYKLLMLARALKEFDLSNEFINPKLREFLDEEV